MSNLNRRQLLQGLLGLIPAAGAIVLARTVLPASTAQTAEAGETKPADIQERADQLAAEQGPQQLAARSDEEGTQPCGFLNSGWQNGGSWNNGGFHNGGWRNGLGWNNGNWINGYWPNGSWTNGGWSNLGWRNFPYPW
jgi:rSAM-associated Gly-rich repeat protein